MKEEVEESTQLQAEPARRVGTAPPYSTLPLTSVCTLLGCPQQKSVK